MWMLSTGIYELWVKPGLFNGSSMKYFSQKLNLQSNSTENALKLGCGGNTDTGNTDKCHSYRCCCGRPPG